MRRFYSHPVFAVLALYAMLVQSTWTGAMGVMASAGMQEARFLCATLAPVDQGFNASAKRLELALYGPAPGQTEFGHAPDCPACQLAGIPVLPRQAMDLTAPFVEIEKRDLPIYQRRSEANAPTGPPLGARAPPVTAPVSFA
jgi:hypothetical protein